MSIVLELIAWVPFAWYSSQLSISNWCIGINLNSPFSLKEGIAKDDLNNPSNTYLASCCSLKLK